MCQDKILSETNTRFEYIYIYIWVTHSYKKQELLTHREHLSSPPTFWWSPCCSSFYFFCVVLLCVFMFWVPCSDVHYVFRIKTMFCSSLPPVVCRGLMSYLCYLCLFAYSVLFVFVLCYLCCQFLWIVHFLFFIAPSVFSRVYLW